MTDLAILIADRLSEMTNEEGDLTREIETLTDRRAFVRSVIAELGRLIDRAPEFAPASAPKPSRAKKGEVEEAALKVLRATYDAKLCVSALASYTGYDPRSVYAAVARLVMVGEIVRSGRPRRYVYRANPHQLAAE
jgi:hypothetical protein